MRGRVKTFICGLPRIRFSDAVTALTGGCVRHGVRSLPIRQPAALLSYCVLVLRCLFNSSLDPPSPLFPFPLLHGPSWLRPWRAPSFPCRVPLFRTEGHAAANEKYVCRDGQLLSTGLLSNIVSSTVPAVGLPSTMMPMKCLAFQVPSDLFTRRLWMRYHHYLPSSLMNESIPSPYFSTMVDKCRVSTLTGWLTHTSSSANLHHG